MYEGRELKEIEGDKKPGYAGPHCVSHTSLAFGTLNPRYVT